ncbi:MAG: hypothetical protein WB973_19465 [Thermoanaerobaculia bacterium]
MIGANVQVVVEQSRVTLITEAENMTVGRSPVATFRFLVSRRPAC